MSLDHYRDRASGMSNWVALQIKEATDRINQRIKNPLPPSIEVSKQKGTYITRIPSKTGASEFRISHSDSGSMPYIKLGTFQRKGNGYRSNDEIRLDLDELYSLINGLCWAAFILLPTDERKTTFLLEQTVLGIVCQDPWCLCLLTLELPGGEEVVKLRWGQHKNNRLNFGTEWASIQIQDIPILLSSLGRAMTSLEASSAKS